MFYILNIPENSLMQHYCMLMAFITNLLILAYYSTINNTNNRYLFAFEHRKDGKLSKNDQILNLLLPSFLSYKIKEGIRYISNQKETVTIIFCNIENFDYISTLYQPKEFINLFDDLFNKFDLLCQKMGVTKIETVGGTYLACVGLTESEKLIADEIKNVPFMNRCVELALSIID
mmetsp:Transcript_37151/g.6631  ORF Transcript_37151/g.6631 Transcript_37151/m.6631 type:complete len:175 (-) Transcript_37151:255-779(-)